MNVFGKKLAARGIYNVETQGSWAKRGAYYDGLTFREDIRGTNQALV